MSEPIYAVLFHVRGSSLPTVLQVLEKSVTLVSVTPTTPDNPPPPEKKKRQHYANGKRFKGISAQGLVLQTLEEHGGICDIDQLEKAFVAHGFARDSYSSAVSYLVTDNKVRRLERGRIATRTDRFSRDAIHKGAGQ